MLAAVSAFIEPAFARAADDRPRLALEARHPRVNNIRIAGLQLNVHRAHAVRDEQDFAPRLPAVSCFENTALVVWLEDVAVSCDPRDVRIVRMNANSADLPGVVEPNELPCLSGVS